MAAPNPRKRVKGKSQSQKKLTKGPPKSPKYQKNKHYEFHRGFAIKVPVQVAESKRFKLKVKDSDISPGKTGHNLVWLSPDGKRILRNEDAIRQNARRRSALTLSDAWRDFKAADPSKAKEVGWNRFQKAMRGIQGSRVASL